MHGTIEIAAKPKKWTERDEYYLRAALESAVHHRSAIDTLMKPGAFGANPKGISEHRQLLARADESVARLLEQKRLARETAR